MACHSFLAGCVLVLGNLLAQAPPSGAGILGSPGIRTRYADPSRPPPPLPAQALPAKGPSVRPLSVPVNESVQFQPTMEEGPFARPTLRGMFRWDLEPPGPR
jgi:hypothetical protein